MRRDYDEIYWLHVDDTGREHRFAKEPNDSYWCGYHEVEVRGEWEFVVNPVIGDRGHLIPRVAVKPHGEGWRLADEDHLGGDNFATWKRPRKIEKHADGDSKWSRKGPERLAGRRDLP